VLCFPICVIIYRNAKYKYLSYVHGESFPNIDGKLRFCENELEVSDSRENCVDT